MDRERSTRERDRRARQLFTLREVIDSFGHYSLPAKFDPGKLS